MSAYNNKLGHSRSLQHFKRESDEAQAWMSEKMQIACDDSYKDPTNLPVRNSYTINKGNAKLNNELDIKSGLEKDKIDNHGLL